MLAKKSGTMYGAVFLCLLSVLTVVVWVFVAQKEKGGVLTVAFLDVGQGDSIYIETPNGNQVLVDGGKGRSVLRELGSVMPLFDRSIDVIIATHPDLDHIGGLPEVFHRFKVGLYLESGVHDDGGDYEALLNAVSSEGIEVHYARRGSFLHLDEYVTLEFLFPDRDVTHLEVNTASVVAKLTYKNTSFLLTGDSPSGIESHLISLYGDALKSDVLKLGHHGSKTSTSEGFLGYVNPTWGVISAGCNNSYGHPSREVMERLAVFEIKDVSTCANGTVVFQSDGERVVLK